MSKLEELKDDLREAVCSLATQEEFVRAHQTSVEEWRQRIADIKIAIAALEAAAPDFRRQEDWQREGIRQFTREVIASETRDPGEQSAPEDPPESDGEFERRMSTLTPGAKYREPPHFADMPPSDSPPHTDEIPEGFTRHDGGKCPIEGGQEFAVFQRDGSIVNFDRYCTPYMDYNWQHINNPTDIIAYRVIPDQVRTTDPEPSPADDRIEPTLYDKEHEQVD